MPAIRDASCDFPAADCDGPRPDDEGGRPEARRAGRYDPGQGIPSCRIWIPEG